MTLENETRPLVQLGMVLSQQDAQVADELAAYVSDPDLYSSRYAMAELEEIIGPVKPTDDAAVIAQELAELVESLNPTRALIAALRRAGHLAYVDWKHEPADTLLQLDQVAHGVLSASPLFEELLAVYRTSQSGIAEYLDPEPAEALQTVVRSGGLVLEALDEDSDAYALVLIALEDLQVAYALADQADVTFYFLRLRASQQPPPPSPRSTPAKRSGLLSRFRRST